MSKQRDAAEGKTDKKDGVITTLRCDECRTRLIDLMTFERPGRTPEPTLLILHCLECGHDTEVGVIKTRFGVAPATVYDATNSERQDSTKDVSEIVDVKNRSGIQTVSCRKLLDKRRPVG